LKYKKWTFKTEQPIFSSACLIPDLKLVSFGCHDNNLYCLNEEIGTLNWKINCDSQIYSSPCMLDAAFLISVSSNGIIFIVNINNGDVILKKDFFNMKNSCYSSPVVYKNRLYIGCRDDYLYSFQVEID